jgi:hypothetical protein
MEKEAKAIAERKKRFLLIISVLFLRARLQLPCLGSSTKGKIKNIDRHQKTGALML